MTKPNIHTKEGWAQFARETNTKSFIQEFGRDPRDYEEVRNWVNAAMAKVNELYPISDEEPEQTLRTFDGKLCWVTEFK